MDDNFHNIASSEYLALAPYISGLLMLGDDLLGVMVAKVYMMCHAQNI